MVNVEIKYLEDGKTKTVVLNSKEQIEFYQNLEGKLIISVKGVNA